MTKKLAILLFSAFTLRLLLSPYLTYYNDLLLYKAWGVDLAIHGSINFYERLWCDYLPGYLYMLMGVTWLREFLTNFGLYFSDEYTYKFIPILFDIISGYFIYQILNVFTSVKKSLIGTAIFLFSVSTLALSSLWGQSDGVVTTFLIGSLYFLIKRKILLAFTLLGLAQITKPIAIISLPIYLIWLIRQHHPIPKIILGLATFFAAILIPFLGFTYNNYNILQTAILRHTATFDQYQYTSLNAFSFWGGLHGFWISDQKLFLGLTYKIWGYLLYSIPVIITLIVLLTRRSAKNPKILLIAAAINYLAMFLFITRMHERHAYYGLAFCLIYFLFTTRITKVFILLATATFCLNLYFAYAINAKLTFNLDSTTITFLSWVNFATLICLIRELFIIKPDD